VDAGSSFDLITCVHGLHYLGDKLAVLARAAGWLTATGRLVADLDLSSIRLPDGRPAGRRLATLLRGAGFTYDPDATGSAAPAGSTSTCPTATSAQTTLPGPTTPANQPSTPTIEKISVSAAGHPNMLPTAGSTSARGCAMGRQAPPDHGSTEGDRRTSASA
jgi:hypothetical protein